jgi:hypothetical protein
LPRQIFLIIGSSKFHQPDEQRQNGGKPEDVSENIAGPIRQSRAALAAVNVRAGLPCSAGIAFNVRHFLA